jgi:hypothetical protein
LTDGLFLAQAKSLRKPKVMPMRTLLLAALAISITGQAHAACPNQNAIKACVSDYLCATALNTLCVIADPGGDKTRGATEYCEYKCAVNQVAFESQYNGRPNRLPDKQQKPSTISQ